MKSIVIAMTLSSKNEQVRDRNRIRQRHWNGDKSARAMAKAKKGPKNDTDSSNSFGFPRFVLSRVSRFFLCSSS